MSVIIVDNACDLSDAQVKKLGLDFVKFSPRLNGRQIAKSAEAYSDACKNYGALSLMVTAHDFTKVFEPYLQNDENILYLSTNQMDYNVTKPFGDAVAELKEKYPTKEILILDLGLTSSIAGVLIYEVGLMYKRGCTDLEIKNFIETFKNEVKGYVITNNNSFISICEKNENVNVKSKLNVVAVVDYNSERKNVVDYVNGRKKAMGQVVDLMAENSVNLADYSIQVSYATQETTAEYCKELIEKKFNNECTVFLQKMDLTNVMTYGADAIVVGFHGKRH